MPKLHALPVAEKLGPARLEGKVVIVLDILFATMTIVHALAEGASRIHPVRNPEEGLRMAETVPGLIDGSLIRVVA